MTSSSVFPVLISAISKMSPQEKFTLALGDGRVDR